MTQKKEVPVDWKAVQLKHALALKDREGNLRITDRERDALKRKLKVIVAETLEKGTLIAKVSVLRSVIGFESYEKEHKGSVPEELTDSELLKEYLKALRGM